MLAFNSPTDRMMARVAIAIFSLGLLLGLYAVGPPLYWRFYATVVHPFESDPASIPAADNHFQQAIDAAGTKAGTQAAGKETGANPATATAPVKQEPKPKGPFNPEDYTLTKELIDSLVQDGCIMVTWANEHYLDFALTWVGNLKKVGVTGHIVGAMDDDMLKALADRGVNTWRMNTGITKNDLGWGSANFHKMGRSKIQLIQTFMAITDATVVISDIDTVWMRNPMPFFNRYPEADILTSTDQLGPTVETEDLERWPDAGSSFNIGIMVFRPKSKAFVDAWVKSLEKPDYWDQTAFNDLVRKGSGKSDEKGLWQGYDKQLTVGILPASQFASGHVFFVQRKYEEYGLKPYVAHATFQYSGTPGKRHRFREFMLFEDPPEYYDHKVGFITFNVDIPKPLMDKAAKPVVGPMTADKLTTHFELVHHQLLYVRAGLALATLTGRVLVLPPIWCQLDKYWAPLYDGNIPGSHFKKPFICPMDHVLDIEGGWHPVKDVNAFGPHVEWREYSFLQNPRLSAAVNNSRLVVEVCKQGEAGCSDGSSPAKPQDGKIRLSPGQNSDKLKASLQDTGSFKILDVTSILKLWPKFTEASGWFTDSAQHAKFVNRLKHLTSVDCCLSTNPGWVWYDFLFDVPHRDRHNRQYTASWQVKLGDQDKKSRALLGVPGSDFLTDMEAAAMHGEI